MRNHSKKIPNIDDVKAALEEYDLDVRANNGIHSRASLADCLGLSTSALTKTYNGDINNDWPQDALHMVKRAYRKWEIWNERALYDPKSCNGAKFSLSKVDGWKEEKTINNNHNVSLLERLEQKQAQGLLADYAEYEDIE